MSLSRHGAFALASLILAGALYACGSSDSGAPPPAAKGGAAGEASGDDAAGSVGDDDQGDDAAGQSGDDTGAAGAAGAPDCPGTTTGLDACTSCCQTGYAAGKTVVTQGLINVCGCNDGADCKTECGNTCTTGTLDDACNTCIKGLAADKACIATFNSDCKADDDCNAYVTCLGECAKAAEVPVCSSGFKLPPSQSACASCLGSDATCCQAYTACAADTACATCAGSAKPDDSCAQNDTFKAVVNCYGVTCKDTCPQ